MLDVDEEGEGLSACDAIAALLVAASCASFDIGLGGATADEEAVLSFDISPTEPLAEAFLLV